MSKHLHKWAELAAAEGHKKRVPYRQQNNGQQVPIATELVDRIRACADSGMTFQQIANEIGVSRSRVSQIACHNGIASPRAMTRQPVPQTRN